LYIGYTENLKSV